VSAAGLAPKGQLEVDGQEADATFSGTLVSIIQNDYVSFSFLQLTYLGITQAVCSITSTFGFWYIQKYFKFRTKSMFLVTNLFSVLIPLWGMVGLWTQRIGYHNRWEFYFYNVVFGLFQAPYYAVRRTTLPSRSKLG
jgi:MFS-type transporter involved in bile tolerance (Atg22 family)